MTQMMHGAGLMQRGERTQAVAPDEPVLEQTGGATLLEPALLGARIDQSEGG